MRFEPPITRVDSTYRGKPTHHYRDANGNRIPGVTTLLNDGLPKPQLITWAAETTASYALDHWDELADKPIAERLKELTGARFSVQKAAMEKGTEVHAIAELLVHGQAVEVPERIAAHVDNYVRFLNDWEPEPVLVERPVVNYSIGYAGTLDLVADMAGQRWLLDIKTGKRVYGETALQLAAYAFAERYVESPGVELPMPSVDRIGVIHVTDSDYELRALPTDELVFRQFRYVAAVARVMRDLDTYVGPPLSPPILEGVANDN